jgi:hypothetical protein
MATPTHDEISLRAYRLWQDQGRPDGIDLDHWLEAERQLGDNPRAARGTEEATFAEVAKAETAAESTVEYRISPGVSQDEAIRAALMKQEARAPQTAHHTGPKLPPAETGKPLWTKPHSR